MSSISVKLTLVLATTLISGVANAYPGAKASGLVGKIVIKSTCFSSTAPSNAILYGYEQDAVHAGADGKCPAGAVVGARTYTQPQPQPNTSLKSEKQVIMQGTEGHGDLRVWTVEHELVGYQHGSVVAQRALDDAAFAVEFQALKTASSSTPVETTLHYPERKIELLKRSKLPSEVTLNIVSICVSNKTGDVYGYTEAQTAPKSADFCPEVFQVVLKRVFSLVRNSELYTFVKPRNDGYGRSTNKVLVEDSVEIFSRYGLSLFSTTVNSGVVTKARIDFKTASPENPVKVTVDEKTQSVLSIIPTVNPYKL